VKYREWWHESGYSGTTAHLTSIRIAAGYASTRAMNYFVGRLCALAALALLLQGCAVPLWSAASAGDAESLRQMLESGRNADIALPVFRTTPLILAAAHGNGETVGLLLDAGANIDAEDLTGWTALHAAAFKGNTATLRVLLDRGARLPAGKWYLPTPLAIAQHLGHTEATDLLRHAHISLTER